MESLDECEREGEKICFLVQGDIEVGSVLREEEDEDYEGNQVLL